MNDKIALPEPAGTQPNFIVCDGTNGSLVGGEKLGQWVLKGERKSGQFTREQVIAAVLAERAAERERCAAICVSHHDDHDDGWETCINVIAAAIRNQD